MGKDQTDAATAETKSQLQRSQVQIESPLRREAWRIWPWHLARLALAVGKVRDFSMSLGEMNDELSSRNLPTSYRSLEKLLAKHSKR